MRTRRSTLLVVGISWLFLGAPCGGGSPAARTFAAGSIVIPMDNCYQRRDATASAQTVNCNAARDDGIFRAYGLVYFLLKHNLTVYWVIDPAKTSVTAADFSVTAAPNAFTRWDWAAGAFTATGLAAQGAVTYLGGPFVVDAADAAKVRNWLSPTCNDPADATACSDFSAWRTERVVDLHEAQAGFSVTSARPLKGVPPRVAILNIGGASFTVMQGYAQSAGFDWPCNPALGNCAGGTADPVNCPPPSPTTMNAGPGLVYDVLCESDFLPDYATSNLGRQGYKLLWAPHWSGAADANACASTTCTGTLNADCALKCVLNSISAFVDANNNLLAECHAIGTLEGDETPPCVTKEPGLPATHFQADAGMCWNGTGALTIADPGHPNTQIGDFVFATQTGSINRFFPASPSGYKPNVKRLIVETAAPHDWDVLTLNNKDDNPNKGVIVYFGGHSYVGLTGGTRLVLDGLFNLGIPCGDPNTSCNTGQPGVCAAGTLRCAAAGGLACMRTTGPSPEICDGLDNDCNGLVDDLPSASCYGGPAGTQGVGVCAAGVQVCSGQLSACQGQILPSPERCNGLDDDCNGRVDDGLTQTCYEGPPGTDTVAPCHPGTQACANGTWGACTGQVTPSAQASCSTSCAAGATRDCYDGPPATRNVGVCRAGTQACTGGAFGVCTGQVLPSPEVCNGRDDDCNGLVDDNAPCPMGSVCTNGACVPSVCTVGELGSPCPQGYTCVNASCAVNPCDGGVCAAGQVCGAAGQCTDPCAGVTCGAGSSCSGGACVAGGCYLLGCTAPQVCLRGACVADPCTGVSCPAGTFCRAGDCVQDCAQVACPAGTACTIDGFCDPVCAAGCAAGQRCQAGQCAADPCAGVGCGRGQVCQEGLCVDDPCTAAHCPSGTCVGGQCVAPDGGAPVVVVVDAGAGPAQTAKPKCGCGATDASLLGVLLAALQLARRPRRRSTQAPGRSGHV